LTGQIKAVLEMGFSDVAIIGETSNFKPHISGHWYFVLKDGGAQISCTMWKGFNNYVFFTPQDGMKVILRGRITVYPPRGNYQIDVRSMKPAGIGELQAQFEKLKQKLAAEGLFDQKYKKPIPRFPQKIGVATAIDGAAFQDMKTIAARRYPLAELVIAPCKVQGEGAADEIVRSIRLLNQAGDIDLIIVGRGGGSLEDLWAFNEEAVARAIFDSKVPVISAVGHEIDFTIADFVADKRAATPSEAMEIATPNKDDLFAFIDDFSYYIAQKITGIIDNFKLDINRLTSSYGFKSPHDLIKNKAQTLDGALYRFQNQMDNKLVHSKNEFALLQHRLEAHNIDAILKRGFAIAKQDDKIVTRAQHLDLERNLKLKFYDGEVEIKK
jgi:exodeoxyribonuclease VII large subunit